MLEDGRASVRSLQLRFRGEQPVIGRVLEVVSKEKEVR
jgi:hypothetical protein